MRGTNTSQEEEAKLANSNGMKLTKFAKEKQIKIVTTSFKREDMSKDTWISPDGRYAY